MSDRLALACLGLLGLLASGCQDACDEARVPLAIDEPGPTGESALDTFGFTQGTRVGTLALWDESAHDVEVTTTLASSANLINREHTGPGRLMCIDSIEIEATIQIKTPNNPFFDDTFTVVLTPSDPDTFATSIEGRGDISEHDFEYLQFAPASTPTDIGVELQLVWMNDAASSLLGWMTLGEDTIMHFEVEIE
jgi:hypothetical protein